MNRVPSFGLFLAVAFSSLHVLSQDESIRAVVDSDEYQIVRSADQHPNSLKWALEQNIVVCKATGGSILPTLRPNVSTIVGFVFDDYVLVDMTGNWRTEFEIKATTSDPANMLVSFSRDNFDGQQMRLKSPSGGRTEFGGGVVSGNLNTVRNTFQELTFFEPYTSNTLTSIFGQVYRKRTISEIETLFTAVDNYLATDGNAYYLDLAPPSLEPVTEIRLTIRARKGHIWDTPEEALADTPIFSKPVLILINELLTKIEACNLANGIANSIDSKIQNAADAYNAENAAQRADAVNKLSATINSIEAQRGNQIDDACAEMLINAVNLVIDAMIISS